MVESAPFEAESRGFFCRKDGRLQLEGVYSVLPTPFTPSSDLDIASLRQVIDLFIEQAANTNEFTADKLTEVRRHVASLRRVAP